MSPGCVLMLVASTPHLWPTRGAHLVHIEAREQQQAQQQGYPAPFPDANQDGIDDRYQNPAYLAQTMTRLHREQPDVLHHLLGPGGALGNPLAKAAVAGIAALAAKQFLGR